MAEAIGLIDRQMAAPRFRGVRPMGASGPRVPEAEVLRALQERNLVFELMTHPDRLREAAGGARRLRPISWSSSSTPDGPATNSDEEHVLWRTGIDALAGLGENVVCKLSGLAMPFGSMGAEAPGPWLEYAIEAFGVDRCMFASNFPVDSMGGTFDELYTTFNTVTAGLSPDARAGLFATNVQRADRF